MIIVIGGGPAGVFAAITAREAAPDREVVLLEKNADLLGKVVVSGGGRCNVTNGCLDPRDLAERYPRGGRELRGPLTRWGPAETMDWFAGRGVALKTEPDGRVFPVSDTSATIVEALMEAAQAAGIRILNRSRVTAVEAQGNAFTVRLADEQTLTAERLLLATGGKTSSGRSEDGVDGYQIARSLGHAIEPPVPSLFTFRIRDDRLLELAGVATEVELQVKFGKTKLRQSGPLLITHRGVSGPAVLVLSAWGARALHTLDYDFELEVNWLPGRRTRDVADDLQTWAQDHGRQQISGNGPGGLPRRLWTALVGRTDIPDDTRWADLGRKPRLRLAETLTETHLQISGQTVNKEEFVTCGGVRLAEVDFRTMASRVRPGLFLAGEVLDIDGVTGGFNFQSCWTTGRLAGLGLVGAE